MRYYVVLFVPCSYTFCDLKKENNVQKSRKIHPLIMYPFNHPADNFNDISTLYTKLVKELSAQNDIYSEPITVLNKQTLHENVFWDTSSTRKKKFISFLEEIVRPHSKIHEAWCVDTCQMWLHGFGAAYENKVTDDDIFWVIPGDFNYSKVENIFDKIKAIPETVAKTEVGLCLGEIQVGINSSKQLIDTYGTYGLLYNWFPKQAQLIRSETDKPRSEFFALNYDTLNHVIKKRWYAYEQMILILLHIIFSSRKFCAIKLGELEDSDQGRDSLSAAMQQVERTERVLKLHWREVNEERIKHFEDKDKKWTKEFREKDAQSGQIRGAALVILEQILDKS